MSWVFWLLCGIEGVILLLALLMIGRAIYFKGGDWAWAGVWCTVLCVLAVAAAPTLLRALPYIALQIGTATWDTRKINTRFEYTARRWLTVTVLTGATLAFMAGS